MNIFVLDTDPVKAAKFLCNEHIGKMMVESAQMLCSAFPRGVAPYKHTHFNHPCTRWSRASTSNWTWLLTHAAAMAEEYCERYNGRIHATFRILEWLAEHGPPSPQVPEGPLTPFVLAIKDTSYHPDEGQECDPVASYRAFYIGDKSRFATWEPRARVPEWYSEHIVCPAVLSGPENDHDDINEEER